MRTIVGLVPLFLFFSSLWGNAANLPKRTMPHQEICAAPLPSDFWSDAQGKPFQSAETWAWNERICLGKAADMRFAPGGSGVGETCEPESIQNKGEQVPVYRRVRPVFLELVLSHEPWSIAARHPLVMIRCALVSGNLDLVNHEIVPGFWFHKGVIDGDVNLYGTKFKRSLSLGGSTVTGKVGADRVNVLGALILHKGARFMEISLRGSRISGSVDFDGSTVVRKVNADGIDIGGTLFMKKVPSSQTWTLSGPKYSAMSSSTDLRSTVNSTLVEWRLVAAFICAMVSSMKTLFLWVQKYLEVQT